MKLRFIILCILLCVASVTSCQQATPENLPSSATPVTPTQTISPTPSPLALTPTTVNSEPFKILSLLNNLDQSGKWEGYAEGSPEWAIKSASSPSLDGTSLLCSITGGAPYSNIHCYQNLPPEPMADIFELTLSFWFSSATSCNNQNTVSTVQALEFTMNKWYQSKRYEFALQWQNVGDGAPQWRYWNPNENEKWVALNPVISECLEGQQWHTITLKGSIQNEQVYYESFIIDNRNHELNISVLPYPTPNEVDRLAVAVQLDGNANQTPYDVFIDNMTFVVKSSQP